MNTFDVWDTLIARRTGRDARLLTRCLSDDDVLRLELLQCYPIAETVAQVQPEDVLVSDYDCTILPELVRQVTGLTNQIIVTDDGKATGTIWPTLAPKPQAHIGDNVASDGTCQQYGIRYERPTYVPTTPIEDYVGKQGFAGLARLMREARLHRYGADGDIRGLQLFQTQSNLPVLFLASIFLHRKLVAEGFERVLMCSRDCFLWTQLFRAMQPLLGGEYEIVYFYTSRFARWTASTNYREYTNTLFERRALIVDLCGTGKGWQTFAPGADVWYLTGHRDCAVPHFIEAGIYEPTNFAREPMAIDVDAQGQPIFHVNPNMDWTANLHINTMHDAFLSAVGVVGKHDFSTDFAQDDIHVEETLRKLIYAQDGWLKPVHVLDKIRD